MPTRRTVIITAHQLLEHKREVARRAFELGEITRADLDAWENATAMVDPDDSSRVVFEFEPVFRGLSMKLSTAI